MWYGLDFPVRYGNRVTPLIDGDAYFGDLLAALRTAERRVTISAWCLTPLMSLSGQLGDEAVILANVLDELSRRVEVYVLLWAGAPVLFEPTTPYQVGVQRELARLAPRVRCLLDRTAHFSHDHHQKAVTIDGRTAYVGGIDLTTYSGNRWDVQGHPLRHMVNWHDVQVRLDGDAAHDVEMNFCQRWKAASGEELRPLPPPGPEGRSGTLQVVRTIPPHTCDFAPDGIAGTLHALLSAMQRARHFIYIENQYLWSPAVVSELVCAVKRNSSERFRIVAVLPADAEEGKHDNDRHVDLLNDTDPTGDVFAAYSLYTAGPAAAPTGYSFAPIYVHAKVMIVDDEWFMIGSTNLNDRGLHSDSEMNVQVRDAHLARDLRVRLWAEHLAMPVDEVAGMDPIDVIDGPWKTRASEMQRCMRSRSIPPAGQIHPYVTGRGPANRLLDIIQAATFDR